jgi:hypothetical protein
MAYKHRFSSKLAGVAPLFRPSQNAYVHMEASTASRQPSGLHAIAPGAYSKDLQVGQSAALNVPVSNVLHLELDTTLLTHDGGCGAATSEWADIHAVGL